MIKNKLLIFALTIIQILGSFSISVPFPINPKYTPPPIESFYEKETAPLVQTTNVVPVISPLPTLIEPPEAPKPNEIITLSFVGDCTIGDDESYTYDTFDEKYDTVKNPAYFFEKVSDVFKNDDFTLINLEGVFTKETKKAQKEYRYKGRPEYVEILKQGYVDGVTLANNHTLDYFQKGFDDTVSILTANNIDYTYFDDYFIKEIKGIKIGFLGYKGWSHETRANELLKKQVKEMRENGVQFIVASYHWGEMKTHTPNEQQKRMAHFAIDNGVDLVVGHHAHVLQGIENYKGKPIVYGLGNFCYGGSRNPPDKDTIIYQYILEITPDTHVIVGESSNIIPARLSGVSSHNNYQPIVATGSEAERILEKYNSLTVK